MYLWCAESIDSDLGSGDVGVLIDWPSAVLGFVVLKIPTHHRFPALAFRVIDSLIAQAFYFFGEGVVNLGAGIEPRAIGDVFSHFGYHYQYFVFTEGLLVCGTCGL